MKLNRTAQTTSRDTHRQLFIRQGGHVREILCALCDERIQMVTVGEAATVASVEPQTILTLVEPLKLHAMKTDEAGLLVCLNSLMSLRNNAEAK
jgi:hypothetical protein